MKRARDCALAVCEEEVAAETERPRWRTCCADEPPPSIRFRAANESVAGLVTPTRGSTIFTAAACAVVVLIGARMRPTVTDSCSAIGNTSPFGPATDFLRSLAGSLRKNHSNQMLPFFCTHHVHISNTILRTRSQWIQSRLILQSMPSRQKGWRGSAGRCLCSHSCHCSALPCRHCHQHSAAH